MKTNYEQWCKNNQNLTPLIRALQSSLPEQYIGYYLQKAFGEDAIEYQKHFDWLGNSSLDIYIPSLQLGIEYNGAYFHSNKDDFDSYKASLCRSHRIRVIRILEQDLQQPKSKKRDAISYYCDKKYKNIDMAINELFKKINKKFGLDIRCDVDIKRDEKDFISHVQYKFYLKTVAHVWPESINYWDEEENHISAFDVPSTSNSCYKLKCPHCGKSFKFWMRYGNKDKSLPYCSCESNEVKTAFKEALKRFKETGEIVKFDNTLLSRRLYDRMAWAAYDTRHCNSKEEAEMYKKLGFDHRSLDAYLLFDSLHKINEEDDNNPDLGILITTSLTTIEELYHSTWAEIIKQIVYDKTIKYKQEGQYHKAYYLFEGLYHIEYKDSGLQMEDCKTLLKG